MGRVGISEGHHFVYGSLWRARRILSHVRKSWNTKSILCPRTSEAFLGEQACQAEQTGQPSQMRLGNPRILELVCLTYLRTGGFITFTRLSLASVLHMPSRSILPQAYRCDHHWEQRLAHDSFKSVSARDLGLSILHTIDSGGSASPLDYDIVVDSTAHAIVRGYLDFQRHEKILKLLRERAYTGVFLDEVSANLLLDHFVDAQEWSAAIEVVWELCLQDYFQSEASISPVTVALALHASKQLIQAGLAEDTFTDSSADNADEEVEYKFVKYIRNPSYDNFFDIQRPRLKLGFTLVHLSDLFSNRLDSIRLSSDAVRSLAATLYQALRLFGLAYSEQLDQLKQELEKFQTAEQLQVAGLSAVVLDKLIHAVESCQTRPDNTAPARGEPVLPTATEVDLAVEQVKRLRELCAQVVAEDFFSRCEDFIQKEVLGNVDCMRAETAAVEQLYNRFEDERNRIWTDHLVSARQRAVIETTKQSLRDLVDEEERLTYFKQSEEILHKSWLAPRSRKERRWSRLKEWQQDLLRQPQRLERERTDRKVRGSNPTSASRLPLSRLGQPGSIPALVLPSGGMAARHRKGATAERWMDGGGYLRLRTVALTKCYINQVISPRHGKTDGSKPHTRIGEHRRKIDRSPRKADEYRTLLKDSAIAEIALDTGQKIDVENVGVLREGLRFTSQRLMIEVVEIAKHLSINRIEGVEDGFGSVKLTRVERLLDACESSRTSKSDVINQKTCKAPASDVKDPRFK
ncbi:hypothetical protein CSKR_110643 [Clonorchis sinensis]|uniref:Uncharacterized protein n=1 Tax=Clonorchis sinensis TaxID=79923 RepID=A0A3R7C618_CLOSI|nr:hypothetical protein CSKR_110643 [Clonorchis sinensis]